VKNTLPHSARDSVHTLKHVHTYLVDTSWNIHRYLMHTHVLGHTDMLVHRHCHIHTLCTCQVHANARLHMLYHCRVTGTLTHVLASVPRVAQTHRPTRTVDQPSLPTGLGASVGSY
jgi:hypothetical protein